MSERLLLSLIFLHLYVHGGAIKIDKDKGAFYEFSGSRYITRERRTIVKILRPFPGGNENYKDTLASNRKRAHEYSGVCRK